MGGDISQAFEVLDDQGHKTGQILDRKTVHDQELWHESVNVWVTNSSGQVLLQLRGPKVDLGPDLWDVAFGTHVRPHEDPADAAIRCLRDELRLSVTKDQLKHLFNLQAINPTDEGKLHRTISHIFLVHCNIPESDFVFTQDRVAQVLWKSLIAVMAEVGGSETAKTYVPRSGDYYSKLFEAMQTQM